LFTEVRNFYAKVLKRETEEGITPEDSALYLLDWLNSQGYENYHEFAAHALSQELISRDKGLNQPPNARIQELTGMLRNAETLVEETEGLITDFDAMHTIPHNLRVLASRIEPSGGPVTVLSQNYGSMSREMSDWFGAHVMGENSNFAKIKASVNSSLFVEGMARILIECDNQLQQERRDLGEPDMETERGILADLAKDQVKRSQNGMREVDEEAARITSACQIMHRHFLGLSSTRVLLKIESARLTDSGETLADIIDQLGGFQERISRRLDRIGKLSEEIRLLEQ
uniref:chemotaxis protein n=1 Tax=Leisingera sp. F5 TaxID=1813816 RepID=UPI0025C26C68